MSSLPRHCPVISTESESPVPCIAARVLLLSCGCTQERVGRERDGSLRALAFVKVSLSADDGG